MPSTLQELLSKVQTEELSPEDRDSFLTIMKSLSSGQVPEDYKKDYKTAADFWAVAGPAINAAKNSPTGKQNIAMLLKEKAGDRFVKAYKPMFNSLLQGVDIATSLSQIKNSNNAIAALVQPGIPQGPGIDPALNNEIYKAQRGTFDTSRALAPVRQANQDAYNAADLTDRQISNGQSGQYGALKQANYNDLLRANGQLPAIADSIKAREQANLTNLIGQRSNFAQQKYANDLHGTQMAMDQYNLKTNSAALLGSTGRSNLRNVFQTLPDNLLRTAGMISGGNQGNQSGQAGPMTDGAAEVPQVSGFYKDEGGGYDGYGKQLERNIVQHQLRQKYGRQNTVSKYMYPYNPNQFDNLQYLKYR